MSRFALPPAAVPAEIPRRVPLQIISSSADRPAGDGWLHEVSTTGTASSQSSLAATSTSSAATATTVPRFFRLPFEKLQAAGLPAMVLDGEIAVPDDRGVTHIDRLSEALRQRRYESLAYFAFDLLHLDGHDLRPCPIEDRKALLRDVVGAAGYPRLVAVDHLVGSGQPLFAAVRQLGAEGIVSKRTGSPYRAAASRDWLKTKVSETGAFVIAGFSELAGRLEAIAVAELQDGELVPVGLVKFGLGKGAEAASRSVARRPHDPFRGGSGTA